ncbi:hypothetical protein [Saccharibacillus kuerlensis]|uniref:HNH endonuclease n=1 Tax=Saccharibacillus kuerlensis TaxID=459527 RepID=A0ABQ2L4A0_9BACL|nr:hypothetical protein [Saccharibacillus kuerlensis]GGO00080.1 hypothetical protein GCM10010969_20880 [Saccharibacillus kuerlensis]
MMPVTIAWMLGAAILVGALAVFLVVRAKRSRQAASNVVDLSTARRRKLKEGTKTIKPEAPLKSKRTVRSSKGAEIRRFTPKSSEERQQPCSRCHKKSDSVGFFVDDYGNLLGVCKECRKAAKNRDLMPL